MRRALALVIVWIWVQLLRLKRLFWPRPFRVVAIRRRCGRCGRRLRDSIASRKVPGLCRKCIKERVLASVRRP